MPQPNIQQMLKQAQEVMAAQQEAQEALKEQKVEASAGGGMVKVVVTGDLKLESLAIDPDAVDPEDVEMLQDLVLAATNEALRQAVDLQEKAMQAASGPGGFDPMQALEGLGLGDALAGLGGPGGGAAGGGAAGGAPGMNRAARRAAAKKKN
jgi:nucleoid-associated protein EbfC